MNKVGVILAAALFCAPAALAADWPTISNPDDARVESIGEQIRLNGVPMRIHRVLSARSRDDLVEFYRTNLGRRHAEASAGDAVVLSQERGDYFVTVMLRALAPHTTEALVAVSDMAEARRAAGRPLGFVLPADSDLLSDMESVDGNRQARQLVFANRLSLDANRDFLTRELASRDLWPDGPPLQDAAGRYAGLYRGSRGEAQLTLVRADEQTHVVLTLIHDR